MVGPRRWCRDKVGNASPLPGGTCSAAGVIRGPENLRQNYSISVSPRMCAQCLMEKQRCSAQDRKLQAGSQLAPWLTGRMTFSFPQPELCVAAVSPLKRGIILSTTEWLWIRLNELNYIKSLEHGLARSKHYVSGFLKAILESILTLSSSFWGKKKQKGRFGLTSKTLCVISRFVQLISWSKPVWKTYAFKYPFLNFSFPRGVNQQFGCFPLCSVGVSQ